jgi:hypothetical protein
VGDYMIVGMKMVSLPIAVLAGTLQGCNLEPVGQAERISLPVSASWWSPLPNRIDLLSAGKPVKTTPRNKRGEDRSAGLI